MPSNRNIGSIADALPTFEIRVSSFFEGKPKKLTYSRHEIQNRVLFDFKFHKIIVRKKCIIS